MVSQQSQWPIFFVYFCCLNVILSIRWLPYLIYGTICLLLGVFLFGFPPKSKNSKITQAPRVTGPVHKKRFTTLVLESTLRCLRDLKQTIFNVKLMLCILATASDGILLKGFLGFIAKYFEFQFELSASTSTIITGTIALLSVIGGTLLSAFIINKFKLGNKQCAFFCFIIYLGTAFMFWILLTSCEETQFVNKIKNTLKYHSKCNWTFNNCCLMRNRTRS